MHDWKVSDHQAQWAQCELRLQEALRKENIDPFKCGIPIFKTLPKAKSVEMLDKDLTTNIFKIYFF